MKFKEKVRCKLETTKKKSNVTDKGVHIVRSDFFPLHEFGNFYRQPFLFFHCTKGSELLNVCSTGINASSIADALWILLPIYFEVIEELLNFFFRLQFASSISSSDANW